MILCLKESPEMPFLYITQAVEVCFSHFYNTYYMANYAIKDAGRQKVVYI